MHSIAQFRTRASAVHFNELAREFVPWWSVVIRQVLAGQPPIWPVIDLPLRHKMWKSGRQTRRLSIHLPSTGNIINICSHMSHLIMNQVSCSIQQKKKKNFLRTVSLQEFKTSTVGFLPYRLFTFFNICIQCGLYIYLKNISVSWLKRNGDCKPNTPQQKTKRAYTFNVI